jgi:predicted O-methyltransferase YrrM
MPEPDMKLIDEVKGFLDESEGRYLFEIAEEASKNGPCLEIGSYCGKSSIYLGTACKNNNGILFSIDHHRGSEEQQPGEEYFDPELFDSKHGYLNTFEEFRRTLSRAGLEDTVVPIVSRSEVAARSWTISLSLVFIDGGHSYESVHTDYKCWAGHIIPGGYLAIHDIFKDPQEGGQGPYEVYKIALQSGIFKEMPMVKSLGILQCK